MQGCERCEVFVCVTSYEGIDNGFKYSGMSQYASLVYHKRNRKCFDFVMRTHIGFARVRDI